MAPLVDSIIIYPDIYDGVNCLHCHESKNKTQIFIISILFIEKSRRKAPKEIAVRVFNECEFLMSAGI